MNGEIAAANQRLASPGLRDDSARLGAAFAFQHSKSPSNVTPQPSVAARAAVASTVNRHAELRRQEMESEFGPEVGSVKDKIGLFAGANLAPPGSVSRGRTPPPSLPSAPEQIAARLAASRSPARKQEATAAAAAARISAARSASRMQPPRAEEHREMRSPIPIRPRYTRPESALETMLQDDRLSSKPVPTPEPIRVRPPAPPSRAISVRSARDVPSSPQPPLPPRSATFHDTDLSPHPSISSALSPRRAPDEPKPTLPPRSTPSQASVRKPVLTGTPLLRPSTPSIASVSGQSHNSSSTTVNESGGMSEEALSNAIVASSLASARASPIAKAPPPPPTRRRARSRSILQLAHSPKSDLSRTPSPPKGMPHTLRGMPKADDADANRRHKMHLLHKHPHKHHEGDRKRWRQEVTEKERRRYEGVWASNRGLFIDPGRARRELAPNGTERWPPPSEMVLNLVVREIWSRSRLPPVLLEQVWDLVDQQQIGLLTKEEFVVGMWLIDQQLKGHKLPTKVPESVWDSVRYVTGIKLSSTGAKN
ncbi:hypothetical protein N7462_004641 [Penicillium macrosclerotiorum]|uniref:uncharacterized protein n=1 Tax=Penicillium macrosclerotiorum TaxID=303699 RepID=UPI0025470009|nr:uncharacterized protein N7462_004641 [Penicillium macrosclerotiorum]KAJ5690249.1 hypothetical protein N7462_004641 [Penicillium macrosclerotiorum]